jgi:hypothetical protein
MKLSITILILIIFQTLTGFPQNSHQLFVSDSISHKGIPYATIKVLNKPDGTYADSLGRFEVKTSAKDSLLVTCVGYQSKIVFLQGDTIFLDPVAIDLGEVKIKNSKSKEYTFGLADSKRDEVLYLCGYVNLENSVMIKIPDSFTYYRIKGVRFNTKHENGISLVRLHIYSQGKDGKPDKEMLPEDIIINKHIKSNGQIDLSRFNLVVNNRVLYVGIEDILSNTKFSPTKGECIGFGFTLGEKQNLTYSRVLCEPKYFWRLSGSSSLRENKIGKPANLMVSLIID